MAPLPFEEEPALTEPPEVKLVPLRARPLNVRCELFILQDRFNHGVELNGCNRRSSTVAFFGDDDS